MHERESTSNIFPECFLVMPHDNVRDKCAILQLNHTVNEADRGISVAAANTMPIFGSQGSSQPQGATQSFSGSHGPPSACAYHGNGPPALTIEEHDIVDCDGAKSTTKIITMAWNHVCHSLHPIATIIRSRYHGWCKKFFTEDAATGSSTLRQV